MDIIFLFAWKERNKLRSSHSAENMRIAQIGILDPIVDFICLHFQVRVRGSDQFLLTEQ